VWYFIASGSLLGTPNVSAPVPQKRVNGDSCIFRQNVAQFPYNSRCYVFSHLVMTTRQMRTPSNFWQNLGQFSHIPEHMATRRRIRSRDIKMTSLLPIYHRNFRWKKIQNQLTVSLWSRLFGLTLYGCGSVLTWQHCDALNASVSCK